ncbi:fumarylacetoacetate hydrolase family protein [Dissulfurimicrobium hydrothermale]|uniref:fumarylacetoacetate hydrolase family protein n=1 Tax=Dissulfurimicrobium hydrothermale TaxID=1750598 RepID=UPI001EDC46D2|nr:fumarylacetoacetate hydrolase family protein [Dissulfurimicrobium hydrothermale]UKL14520.1 fumarylacetoacetate hydrolase family protein [Dissulfurimicrobium hydrothermale]
MKLVRFMTKEKKSPRYGIWRDGYVRVIVADPFEGMIVGTSETYQADEVILLAPCTPSKIVAVGLNYKDHAEELKMPLPDEPLIFLKPPSSVIGQGDEIVRPGQSNRVDYEAELGVVIGRKARNVPPQMAKGYILGYTCINDVTARDLQMKDVQFTRAKGFDTFCPIGPWIETEFDPSDALVECRLNGELKQSSRTSQFIHDVPELISFISHIMTLEPGDVVSTGTPKGIGPMDPGDEVIVSIEGIGELRNKVI